MAIRTKIYERLTEEDKNNDSFVDYYQRQEIVPREEWDHFYETLKRDLPSSFRLTGCNKEANILLKLLEERYFGELCRLSVNDTEIETPTRLLWYPDGFAFQMKMPRHMIKKNTLLNELHNFLVTETQLGNVSRQETVSMIPPLLLNILPHHKVLDMCAAPGSKTMQMVEMLHRDILHTTSGSIPDGFVVANDADNSRCYLLVHQVLKRRPTPSCIVTNHDAAYMPNIRMDTSLNRFNCTGTNVKEKVDQAEAKSTTFVAFDRILCDIICSGDGTFRKNPDLWRKWSPGLAMGLHRLQIKIAKRGLELLAVGGLMVYSTCSLNPIENEAVLVELLEFSRGSVELVDVSNELLDLKRLPGILHWKVIDKNGTIYETVSHVPENLKSKILESMFPPPASKAHKYHLDRSFRILPHYQNTGGFFVAVLRKKADFVLVSQQQQHYNSCNPRLTSPDKKRKRIFREDPFVFLQKDDVKWLTTREYYGIVEEFEDSQLLGRTEEGKTKGSLYLVSEAIRQILQSNGRALRVINAGVRMFGRSHSKMQQSSFRLVQDGLPILLPFLTKRSVEVSSKDLCKVLLAERGCNNCPLDDLEKSDDLKKMKGGSLAIWNIINGHKLVACTWLGTLTISPYVSKEQRVHMLRMLGYDATAIEQEIASRRKCNVNKKRIENRKSNGNVIVNEDKNKT